MNNGLSTEQFERCVLCGALTCVPISMPIDWREDYEVGIGQICVECARKHRKVTERENTLTNEQIMFTAEHCKKEDKA